MDETRDTQTRVRIPLRAVFERMSEPLVAVDGEGRLQYVNPAFCALTGFASEMLEGAVPPFPFWPEERAETYAVQLRELLGGAPARPTCMELRTRDDRRLEVQASAASRLGSLHFALFEAREGAPAAESRERLRRYEESLSRIALELEQLGLTAGPQAESGAQPTELRELSRREWDVLRSFLAGEDIQGTAQRLEISPHTVRNHLKSIYRKLGVRSQRELLHRLSRPAQTFRA